MLCGAGPRPRPHAVSVRAMSSTDPMCFCANGSGREKYREKSNNTRVANKKRETDLNLYMCAAWQNDGGSAVNLIITSYASEKKEAASNASHGRALLARDFLQRTIRITRSPRITRCRMCRTIEREILRNSRKGRMKKKKKKKKRRSGKTLDNSKELLIRYFSLDRLAM